MGKLRKVREEIFAHKVIQHKGDAEKALEEIDGRDKYKNEESFKANAKNLLYKADVKERILELLDVIYNPNELHNDIQEIRQATKPIVYNGEITAEHPDYATRLDLIKLYFKARKVTNSEGPTNQTNVQFNVNAVDPAEVLKIAQEVSELSKSITPDKSGRRN